MTETNDMRPQKEIICSATKWSFVSEFFVKLVSPIANLILARVLTPEAFGIIATITIIVSMAEVFQDAGFQKYIIQHEYANREELDYGTGVALTSSIAFSLFLWFVIVVFSRSLASAVGNPNLSLGIIIACFALPLTALTGVPLARFRRDFRFKELFYIRVAEVFSPLYLTVPLALFVWPNYWALVFGTLGRLVVRAIGLFVLNFKNKYYLFRFVWNFNVFKQMFNFSMWTMFEYLTIWLSGNVYIFIITHLLNEHYVGVFNVSTGLISSLFAIFSAAFIPVAFSTFSRLQNDIVKFRDCYYEFQRHLAFFLFPAAIICFMFRDTVRWILLGDKWCDATLLIGITSLISSVLIVGSHLASEVYRAMGKPKLSAIVQLAYISLVVPTIYYGAKEGFETLVYVYPVPRLFSLIFDFIALFYIAKISPIRTIVETLPFSVSSLIIIPIIIVMQQFLSGYWMNLIGVCVSGCMYFLIVLLFPSGRDEIKAIFQIFK